MTRKERLEFIDKWIAALRSGEYPQGRMWLRNGDNRFCCLGVGCDLLGATWVGTRDGFYWPSGIVGGPEDSFDVYIYHNLGFLTDEQRRILTNMNDDGNSFAEIADWIEAHKEELAGVDHA